MPRSRLWSCAASSAASAATTAAASVIRFGVVLMLVALSSSAGQSSGASCPAGVSGHTVVFGGLCYQFVNVEKTWMNAQRHCRQQSRISPGRLVNVPDAATQSWLVAQISVASWTRNNGVWLGLHDRDNEQHFVWDQYDGRDTPATYTNWAPGEPDNTRNQNCVYMRRQYGWKWVDVECSSLLRTYFFICQYRLVGGSETTTLTAATTARTSTYAPTSSVLATTLRLSSTVRPTYTTKVIVSPSVSTDVTGSQTLRALEQPTSMQPLRTATSTRPVLVTGSSVPTTRPVFDSAASATATLLSFRTPTSVVTTRPVSVITNSVTSTRPVSGTPIWATSTRPESGTTTPTTRPVFRATSSATTTQPLYWWVTSARTRWPVFWTVLRASTTPPFSRPATSVTTRWPVFWTSLRASTTTPFSRPTTSVTTTWPVVWTAHRASTTPPFYRPATTVATRWPVFWTALRASTTPPFARPATSVSTALSLLRDATSVAVTQQLFGTTTSAIATRPAYGAFTGADPTQAAEHEQRSTTAPLPSLNSSRLPTDYDFETSAIPIAEHLPSLSAASSVPPVTTDIPGYILTSGLLFGAITTADLKQTLVHGHYTTQEPLPWLREDDLHTDYDFATGGELSNGQANGTGCPSDVRGRTVVYGGLCYQFVPEEKTWVNARQHCRQQSRFSPGRLVNVPDAAAQRWLVAQMNVAGWTRNNGVWLGLHDRDSELHFVWDQYDGQDTLSPYRNWAPAEPDNNRNQNCVVMRRQFGWKWADVECNSALFRTYFFICQYRLVGGMASPTVPSRAAASTSSTPSQYSFFSSAATARLAVTTEEFEIPQASASFGTLGALRMTTSQPLSSSDSDSELTKLSSSSTATHAAAESLATAFERVPAKFVPTSVTATETPITSVQDQTTEGARDGAARLSSINDSRLVTHYNFETAGLLTDPIGVYYETPSSPHTKTSDPVAQGWRDVTHSSRTSSEAPLAEASYASEASLRNTSESSSYSAYDTAADASLDVATTAATVLPADSPGIAELRTVSGAVLTNAVTLTPTLKSKGNDSTPLESRIEFSLSAKTSNGVGLYVGLSVGAATLLIGTVTAIALMKRTKMLQARSRQNLVLRPAGIENPVYSAADHSESATFYRHSNGPAEVCSTMCSPDRELRFPLLKQVGRC